MNDPERNFDPVESVRPDSPCYRAVASFCNDCARQIEPIAADHAACIAVVRRELPRLLLDHRLIGELLDGVMTGDYPDSTRSTLFDNEVFLYADPQRTLSLRLYLWGPGEYCTTHDHNSWGVLGSVLDGYEVVNYRREDDHTIEGYAKLAETERIILDRGETASTLPFDAGIHSTGNPTRVTGATLNLYGRPVAGRNYLNAFDPVHHCVHRILPPKAKKRYLASLLMTSLDE